MKLFVTAKILDKNISESFYFPVGDGDNSFKWFGLAVSQRILARAPKGEIYHRGLSIVKDSHILPVNISGLYSSFYHPHASVNEYLKDGDTVIVELRETFELDENSLPILSLYYKIAFCVYNGPDDKYQLEAKANEIMTADSVLRYNKEHQDHCKKVAPMLLEMRSILKGHLDDETLMRVSAEEDWTVICSSLLQDTLPNERAAIFEVFLSHFSVINNFYKHYGAISGGGSSATMEYVEFIKFMTDLGLSGHEDLAGNIVSKTFVDEVGSLENEASRPQFVACIIRLARYIYILAPKRKKSKQRETKRDKSISYFRSATCAEAFNYIVQDFFIPLLNHKSNDLSIVSVLGSEDVLLYLYEKNGILLKVFEKYTSIQEKEECSISDQTVDIQEFTLLCNDAGLLSYSGDDVVELTNKDIRQIFALAQHDTAIDENEQKLSENQDNEKNLHLLHMVYAEFLEAVVRIGILKWTSNDMTALDKVKEAVNFICSLAD